MYLFIFIIIAIAAVICFVYSSKKLDDRQKPAPTQQQSQPMHFDLLDDDGNHIKEDTPISATSQSKVKVVIGGGDSDAPVQKFEYFCIKDKGYHVTVWPNNISQFDIVEFNIAGMSHRDNIDNYLGEFKGTLEAEPTNSYDPNAIKVLAPDGHHVGYVPADMTSEIRNEATLPCPCFCYIGCNNGTYFSDCYIPRK
jgi:hypothetical protein